MLVFQGVGFRVFVSFSISLSLRLRLRTCGGWVCDRLDQGSSFFSLPRVVQGHSKQSRSDKAFKKIQALL